jgi:ribosomal protein L11 methyltransferase
MGSRTERFFSAQLLVERASTGATDGWLEEAAEFSSAECFAAGAAGVEERAESQGILLVIYAEHSVLQQVMDAGCDAGARVVGEAQEIEDLDWSEQWKVGIKPLVVSDRLVVRPSFVPIDLVPGQKEIIIDPGQAFGTGGHASTSLVLEWLDELSPELSEQTRVLDIGSGTGVLAMSALALGAGHAVGFDLDARAGVEARVWAELNGFASRLSLFTGGIEALNNESYDLVLANLLSSEMLPIAEPLVARIKPGGRAVFSGLLATEQEKVETSLAPLGLRTLGARFLLDVTGDHWVSLLMGRA